MSKRYIYVLVLVFVLGLLILIVTQTRSFPLLTTYKTDNTNNYSIPELSPTSNTPVSKSKDKQVSVDNYPILDESVKPRTEIDINTWSTYEDNNVGIKFKYPPEWGTAQGELTDLSDGVGTGWGYRIRFPNSNFIINGVSSGLVQDAGTHLGHFKGFGYGGPWDSPEEVCKNHGDSFLYCQPSGKHLHTLTGWNDCYSLGGMLYGIHTRMLFLDRPEKKISGLVFRGTFLSDDYNFVKELECSSNDSQNYKYQATHIITKLNEAIIGRKLDDESIKNFDQIEKLFETIQEI